MERRHAPDARDATGQLISECYCPRCDHFSGGGLCRVCRRELAIGEQNATLVSCIQSSLAKVGDVGQDLVGGLGPDKRFGVFVGDV